VRPGGWGFATAFPGSARWDKAGENLLNGLENQSYRQIRANHQGVFAFRTLLEHLQWDIPENWRHRHPEARGMLYPYALVETTVTVLRLAACLWQEHLHHADVHVLLRLARTRNWLLPPHGPRAVGYQLLEGWHAAEKDTIACGLHRLPAESFTGDQDSLALDLLADLYAEFDYTRESIPCFDLDKQKFHAPC